MSIKRSLPLLLVTCLCLMTVAIYNGFPLVESDTGAYIEQAMYPHFAADRSPFYGLFVRVSTLWTSLWFTVAAQSLILAYLLLRYIRYISGIQNATINQEEDKGILPAFPLLTVITIVSFTCVSWVTGYLMPDVFTGILLLAVFLYIAEQDRSAIVPWLYIGIIFVSTLIHNSHILILGLFAGLLLLQSLIKKRPPLARKSLLLLGVCVGVWVVLCSMNKIKKHGFVFSRGSDIFMVARFDEAGILKQYLDDNCGKKNIDLCNYKNNLPGSQVDYLWSGESPLYKTGGWDSAHPDYKIIIHDVFTTPKYMGMFLQKSVVSTLKEAIYIQAPDKINALGAGSEPWKKVRQYFADEQSAYNTSLQNSNALSTGSSNLVYILFFICSSLWILLFYPVIVNKHLMFIYGCIVAGLLINAFVTATLSTVVVRYQCRVSWILPATNAIVILQYYFNKYKKKDVPKIQEQGN